MKKNTKSLTLILSALLVAFMVFGSSSCKHDSEPDPVPTPQEPWSPDPINGHVPESVLPVAIGEVISDYFVVYSGENPAPVRGQFVSKPHVLMATSLDPDYHYPDSIIYYNDRYLYFERSTSGGLNFYGKQWDDDLNTYYEEVYRNLNSVGEGENFTCYFLTEGYPNGMYALQSTIFSGKWNDNYRGLKDFQVAVILLENSGNPNLAPKGSFRVLGDGDGLARDTNWMAKRASFDYDVKVSDEDAFRMFRVK